MAEYDEQNIWAQIRCYEISEINRRLGYFSTSNNNELVAKRFEDKNFSSIITQGKIKHQVHGIQIILLEIHVHIFQMMMQRKQTTQLRFYRNVSKN